MIKLNPDTSRIKNNPPNKNTKICEEFSLKEIRKIYEENKKKKDAERKDEINKLTKEFKNFIKNKIYSEASKGRFYTYILKDDFIAIFGNKYNKGYYPEVAKEIITYLQNEGFYVLVPCNEVIQEDESFLIEWKER